MLRVVNLAPKQRHTRAVFLGVVDELERIVSRPCAAAQNSDDQIRIILREFLHRLRPVIYNLEELRPARIRDACQRTQNVVVDELAEPLRWNA